MERGREQAVESKSFTEIHVGKMHFRVISIHPQHSGETEAQIKRDMRRELYQIFKNYR
ncbi:transcriptional regulator [Lachnospiraceae bacterium 29-84]